MKKFILTTIIAIIGNIAFCQEYDIKFKIEQEATEKMGTAWDLSFKDATYNPAYYVEFNGTTLKISNGTKDFLNKKVNSVKSKDKKKNVYGKEVTTGKNITIGIEDNGFMSYYILKYYYLESGGYFILLYCPTVLDDGTVYAYNIYQSELFK